MAEFQSVGIMPQALDDPGFYRTGTKIELMMNPDDRRYGTLTITMYNFLRAQNMEERWGCNAAFVKVGQEILKEEWETLKREIKEASPPPKVSKLPKHP